MQIVKSVQQLDRERKEFPPDLKLNPGDSVVLMASEIRLKQKTRNGLRDVVEVIDRREQKWTVWWPKSVAEKPPLWSPFVYSKADEFNFVMVICDTEEEETYLWQNGKPIGGMESVPMTAAIQAGPPDHIAAMLKKFGAAPPAEKAKAKK